MCFCSAIHSKKGEGNDTRIENLSLPLLTSNAKSEHESFFFTFRKHAALRKGDWKIVRERPDEPWQLFNLKNDLTEAENLAAVQKERLLELSAEFDRWE